MTRPVATAQFFPWDGGAVFVGRGGEFALHEHQAIQICFLFEGRIGLRERDGDPWMPCDLGIVPSQHAHAMNGGEQNYGATLFVEPETREGRILAERYLRGGIASVDRAPVAALLAELFTAVREQRGRAAVVELARRIVQTLTQLEAPTETSDERILRAVKFVNERLGAPLTLEDVAKVAHLSPSRFRHLFAEQVGMGLRQYILWRRFVAAWELRTNGASLSAAAHAAGFADSAHLTRTCRSMMGIPPSAMQIPDAAEE